MDILGRRWKHFSFFRVNTHILHLMNNFSRDTKTPGEGGRDEGALPLSVKTNALIPKKSQEPTSAKDAGVTS